ncbi:MAG: hypothetical protein K5894_09840 [Lachnospiraceae bacterium]|nr:hypothetical protein [Lachnospiraceae bacterium]
MKKYLALVLAGIMTFTFSTNAFAASAQAVQKVQQVIPMIITPQMTNAQKVYAVNNYMVNNITYDHTFTNYTADSAILNGTAVCQGYAEAFKVFMDQLGIPCTVVTGYVAGDYDPEDHAWNRVLIDGVYYEIDVTWNDSDSSDTSLSNLYTLLSHEEMEKWHGVTTDPLTGEKLYYTKEYVGDMMSEAIPDEPENNNVDLNAAFEHIKSVAISYEDMLSAINK